MLFRKIERARFILQKRKREKAFDLEKERRMVRMHIRIIFDETNRLYASLGMGKFPKGLSKESRRWFWTIIQHNLVLRDKYIAQEQEIRKALHRLGAAA